MQSGERQNGKHQVPMGAPYFLSHKTNWVLEEEMAPFRH